MKLSMASQESVSYNNVWSGTERRSQTELIDEFGEIFTLSEFADKINVKKNNAVTGRIFPEYVILTRDFKLKAQTVNGCMCLCKSFDIPLWTLQLFTASLLVSAVLLAIFTNKLKAKLL